MKSRPCLANWKRRTIAAKEGRRQKHEVEEETQIFGLKGSLRDSKERDLDLREEAVEAARLEVVVNGVVWTSVTAGGGGGGGSVPADTDHSTTAATTIGPAASHVLEDGSKNNRDNHLTASSQGERFEEEEEEEGRECGTHCVFPSRRSV